MTLLVDSHVIAWMITDKRQISPVVASMLRESSRSGTGVAMASSSLWEVGMMASRGEIRLQSSILEFLQGLESVFVVLPITAAIAARSLQFSDNFSRDPADRIIAATAIVHGLRLVTKDKAIRSSGEVPCVW
jgi:PIN domain nuclease of toxin-antitoxin system